MSDGQILFLIIVLLIALIIYLNVKSDMLAEEVRKSLIIDELPLNKGDISKLFTKKKKHKSKRPSSKRGSINFDSFNEFSPLKVMGYTVGQSGLEFHEREHVLQLSIFGNIQRYMPDNIDYDRAWGAPGSKHRFGAVYTHIRRVKNLRSSRINMTSAVSDWNNDLMWINTKKSEVYHFRLFSGLYNQS